MNITKTNMLLLDNRIKKEDSGNTTVQAPVPSTVQPQAGMNALMFQGMKNLMSDPNLAQEAGVSTDNNSTDKKSAKGYVAPYSSNMAFKGGAIKKFGLAAMMALATMGGMTSCTDKDNVAPIEVLQISEQKVDFSQFMELITLLEQQIADNRAYQQELIQEMRNGREQDKEYYEKILARLDLQNQKLDAQLAFIEKIYARQGETNMKLDEIKNDVYAYLETIISLQEDGNANINALRIDLRAKADEILSRLKEDGSNFYQIMMEIKNLINENNALLSNMLDQLKQAHEDRLVIIARLEDIEALGETTVEELDAIRGDLADINNTIIESSKALSDKLDETNSTIKNGVKYLAGMMHWTEAQTLQALANLGIKIDANTNAQYITSGMLKGALDALRKAAEKENELLADNNAKLDELNEKVSNLGIQVGTFMEEFIARDDAKQETLSLLLLENTKANKSLDKLVSLGKTVVSNQEEEKGILLQMSKDIKQIDKDVIKTKNELANALGVSTMIIDQGLKILGYSMAQINTMNTAAIINAFTNCFNEQNELIDNNGNKLDTISGQLAEVLEKLDNKSISDAEALAEITRILNNIDSNVSDIKELITTAIDNFNQYAADRAKAEKELLAEVKSNNRTQQKILSLGRALLGIELQQNAELESIKSTLESGFENMNTGFKNVCKTIGISEAKLESVLIGMGYTQAQIQKMTAADIIKAINKNTAETKTSNSKLQTIIDKLDAGTLTSEQAASQIIELLEGINENVSAILNALNQHFAKYDKDMAELKAWQFKNNAELKQIKNYGKFVAGMASDIRNMTVDLKDIKNQIKNGVSIDYSKLQAMFDKINANQQMSADQIIARLDAFIAGQEGLADKLDTTNDKLDKLGFVVSNDVITAINNISVQPDDKVADAVNALNAKMEELLKVVKQIASSLDSYAKSALQGISENNTILGKIEAKLGNIGTSLSLLTTYVNQSNNKLDAIKTAIDNLKAEVAKLEAKYQRPLTADELQAVLHAELTEHDAGNQSFYENLLKQYGASSPADLSEVVDLQKASNALLLDILNKLKAMDKTAPDYNEKLNQIIDLLKNFKCECTCSGDSNNNQQIHEGVIGIIE